MSGPVGSAGRRAGARRARRRQRRQLVAAVLAVAVVATLLVTAFLVQRDTPPPEPSPGAAPRGRTQSTLLLQLRAATGEATASVLLAHDPAVRAGAGLLVPSQVLVSSAVGPAPFGSVLRSGTGAASRSALRDLVGVTVDAGWVLDPAAAALLVDAVGGVEVTVEVAVPVPGGTTVAPGRQTLTGPAAVAFATAQVGGESEPARLARLRQLVDGVLARLPVGREQVAGVLAGLGTGSVIEGTMLDGLGALLAGLAADGVQAEVLPVLPAPAGEGTPLDPGPARVVVERLLAASLPAQAPPA